MVWAAFNGSKRSALVFCDRDPETKRGGVSGRVYLQLLQDHLRDLCNTTTVFMQDNVPIHTFKPVKQ